MAAAEPPKAPSVADHVEREIDRFLDLWKHTDARVPANWTVLLAVAGTSVSLAALYDRSSRYPMIALVAGLLCAAAFLTGFRIVGTDLTKTEYFIAINMLRGRVASTNPGLRDVMFIPPLELATAEEAAAAIEDHMMQRLPTVPRLFLYMFTGSMGGAAAWSFCVALAQHPRPDSPWAIAVGAVFGFLIAMGQARVLASYMSTRITWAVGRFERSLKR